MDVEDLNNAIKLELMAIYGILHPQIWEFHTYGILIKIDPLLDHNGILSKYHRI